MTTVNADALIEDRSLRERYSDMAEALDAVKELPALKGDVVTINQLAEYYEVSKPTVNRIINENKDELSAAGLEILEGEALKRFKEAQRSGGNKKAFHKINSLTVLKREAVLRLGMMLSESEVARELRLQLVNGKEVADVEVPVKTAIVDDRATNTVRDGANVFDIGENLRETINNTIKFQHETMQQQNELIRQLLMERAR
ncbi:MAG: hypothetical protein FH756_10270 [Firmicutes bacterium]|nr:hypothetical protein [Bacillota bacterium]